MKTADHDPAPKIIRCREGLYPSLRALLRLVRKRKLALRPATKRPAGQITRKTVKPSAKNILLFRNNKSDYILIIPSDERGGSRSSRTCGGMRWTRRRRMTSAVVADGESVWSWHPEAGVKFAGSKTSGGRRWL